jgi:ADP-dependent NAD(P)H-hydrate dehydratase / NAD(P)H-hydrate epimerase
MSKRITKITQKQVAGLLPKRPRDSHKGLFGTVAVIGGASGMIGAPLLAARAALKLGAGCVHVGLLAENAPGVDMQQPELMLHSAAAALQLPDVNVLAVGCGLGHDVAAQQLFHDALNIYVPNSKAALVLDADALNILVLRPDLRALLTARKAASVLTPHPGEAANLLACSTTEIQADRVAAVQRLAQQFACSVVLKGADSLCATSDGKIFVNKTGNPGMSSAGMGDVLTGMIAAFIAQGLSADDAMLSAVHLHGAAGDALAEQGITIGMTATEVTEWARWLLNQWL